MHKIIIYTGIHICRCVCVCMCMCARACVRKCAAISCIHKIIIQIGSYNITLTWHALATSSGIVIICNKNHHHINIPVPAHALATSQCARVCMCRRQMQCRRVCMYQCVYVSVCVCISVCMYQGVYVSGCVCISVCMYQCVYVLATDAVHTALLLSYKFGDKCQCGLHLSFHTGICRFCV